MGPWSTRTERLCCSGERPFGESAQCDSSLPAPQRAGECMYREVEEQSGLDIHFSPLHLDTVVQACLTYM